MSFDAAKLPAALYIVATPIGNFSDITLRALEVLKGVDLIAAEDTRHSAGLLQHFGITTPLTAVHDFSRPADLLALVRQLEDGRSVALVSDAGTPTISDPGFELVNLARSRQLPVVPVPGASALLAALCVAGLPTNRFLFEGFLPAKAAARRQRLEILSRLDCTWVCFESTHRIMATLTDMEEILSGRRMCLARELTKKFEMIHVDVPAGCIDHLQADPVRQKGEFALVVAAQPAMAAADSIMAEGLRVLDILLPELSIKQAATLSARIAGAPRNALYSAALERKPG
ncbi:MAG: hypothetical protein RLZZ385_1788 [Pseudomonadota bacterium]|jgi:16S rRNA (cytidine1402-2'-O)-methyltransferase